VPVGWKKTTKEPNAANSFFVMPVVGGALAPRVEKKIDYWGEVEEPGWRSKRIYIYRRPFATAI
jgi:hypothetical protein